MIGRTIGHYQVVAKIGEGGMGEVYRATDTKLKREVALKILPASFAQDPERMSRFQREAEVLALLNHPNIAGVYGLEHEGNIRAIAMELVDGQTLAARISQGGMPPDEAFAIALQIARALEAAHEKGIVHRDLKPANVIVTPDGTVKVLDFGLAKSMDTSASGDSDLANSPTMTNQATQAGMILGTAAYMSPEQARGRPVDKRCDIWSFGVVLHEMLTGRALFAGETVSDVLAHVLTREPDWDSLPKDLPPAVLRLLRRCLHRSVPHRLRDIGEARVILEDPASPLAGDPVRPEPEADSTKGLVHRLATILIPLLALLAVWGWWPRSTVPTSQGGVTRAVLEVPADSQIIGASFSLDGTRLAYSLQSRNTLAIMVRRLDELEAQPVPGGDSGVGPFFSPDAEWIVYTSMRAEGNHYKKIRTAGGRAVTLAPATDVVAPASWSEEGWLVVVTEAGLAKVAETGGDLEYLTQVNVAERERHFDPHLLPGATALIYTRVRPGQSPEVKLLDLTTDVERVLLENADNAKYLPTGHLVFLRDDTLYAVLFDLRTQSITGTEIPVIADVGWTYAVSSAGHLVYSEDAGGAAQSSTMAWVDSSGAEDPLPVDPRRWEQWSLRLSRDGRQFVGAIRTGDTGTPTGQIWKYDVARSLLAPVTFEGDNRDPIWSPDGRHVTYRSRQEGHSSLQRVSSSGSGPTELLLTAEPDEVVIPQDWTPDGTTLLYVKDAPGQPGSETVKDELWTLRAPFGEGASPQLLLSALGIGTARISPDGHFVAYESRDSGRLEVYIVPLAGGGARTQVSNQGGGNALWAESGDQIFYYQASREQPATLMAVDVKRSPTLSLAPPRAVFEVPGWSPFGVVGNGEKFLTVRQPNSGRFVLVTNWFDELKRLVPRGQNR